MALLIEQVQNGYYLKITPNSEGFGREWVLQNGTDECDIITNLFLSLGVISEEEGEQSV